MISLNVDAADH